MAEAKFTFREMNPSETEAVLRMRNETFTPLTREKFDAMGCTSAIAKKGKDLWGAIPLQFREFTLRPGVSIPVIFENAVGVTEKARGMGLGTNMIEAAAEFLQDRVDAMFVYRGGERSAGYRFYRKTHHGDLYYVFTLMKHKPTGEDNNVEVLPWDEIPGYAGKLLPLYRQTQRGFGGHWVRDKGYYEKIVASHVHECGGGRLLLDRKGDKIAGYAVINTRMPNGDKTCCIYDLAASASASSRRLLSKIEYLAHKDKTGVHLLANHEHPLYAPLLKNGYVAQNETPYIMARIIRPDRIFQKLAKGSALLDELELLAVTPHRDIVINRPKKPQAKATLYLKESQFSRLMTCRLDFTAALKTNQIRLDPLDKKYENGLAKAFEFAPWAYWAMDYI
jgi:GNAT superfamily N-acetyltransferase